MLLIPYLFTQVYAISEDPPLMIGQKMIYDPVYHRVILFGGSFQNSSKQIVYGDTWSLDVGKATWTKVATQSSPSGRFDVGMAYDNDSKRIVLFGGVSTSGRLGDTWIYDVTANTWTDAAPRTSPQVRSDMGITYDSDSKKIVIFSGYGEEDKIYEDTWVYDTTSNTWAQKTPETHPIARYGGAMVYDTYMKKTLLFGGHLSTGGYENEIWAYDYLKDDWEKLETQNKPPIRYWHDMAYDPEGNRIILFGGTGAGSDLDDTWIYSCRSQSWSRVISSETPGKRSLPSLAYVVSMKKTVLFGGAQFSHTADYVYYNGTWSLDMDGHWGKLSAESDVIFDPIGGMRVSVKDSDGNMLSEVSVSSTKQPSGQAVIRGVTGADGALTFTGLAVGNYTLQVSKSGYISGAAQGAVASGATTELCSTLQAQPSSGIPGFPVESLVIGVLLNATLLWLYTRNPHIHG
jgi:N-acetylneuraminic acid mutarotase